MYEFVTLSVYTSMHFTRTHAQYERVHTNHSLTVIKLSVNSRMYEYIQLSAHMRAYTLIVARPDSVHHNTGDEDYVSFKARLHPSKLAQYRKLTKSSVIFHTDVLSVPLLESASACISTYAFTFQTKFREQICAP